MVWLGRASITVCDKVSSAYGRSHVDGVHETVAMAVTKVATAPKGYIYDSIGCIDSVLDVVKIANFEGGCSSIDQGG